MDEPKAEELLEAVASFLQNDAAADLDGRKRYHALVAANVVRIVAREITLKSQLSADEIRQLETLLSTESILIEREEDLEARALALNELLSIRIADGAMDAPDLLRKTIETLTKIVEGKLRVDRPELLDGD